MNTRPTQLWLRCLNNSNPISVNESVRVYRPSKKEIGYSSASNITAVVETRPPLHNLVYFSPSHPIPNILRASSPELPEVLRYMYFKYRTVNEANESENGAHVVFLIWRQRTRKDEVQFTPPPPILPANYL